ncbi:hypothetical protein V22_05950 [Calycomorphotria hydatis]|uniref:Uncharacterized protein n=1 Tax=Calycomorphotria hydatis TaxID=2528027 RepID=A0A517T4T1_9PLAN|nr:hypothetical protein V22_05950 [Calycomorphotria hydatis]
MYKYKYGLRNALSNTGLAKLTGKSELFAMARLIRHGNHIIKQFQEYSGLGGADVHRSLFFWTYRLVFS